MKECIFSVTFQCLMGKALFLMWDWAVRLYQTTMVLLPHYCHSVFVRYFLPQTQQRPTCPYIERQRMARLSPLLAEGQRRKRGEEGPHARFCARTTIRLPALTSRILRDTHAHTQPQVSNRKWPLLYSIRIMFTLIEQSHKAFKGLYMCLCEAYLRVHLKAMYCMYIT